MNISHHYNLGIKKKMQGGSMKKRICGKCNEHMKLIDKYSQFLEPDEIERFTDQKKINNLVSKMNETFSPSKVNVEIYKCEKCGEYKGVEYV